MDCMDYETSIKVRSGSEEFQKIRQNSTQVGIKSLGVHLTPHGNLDNELVYLKTKATHISVGFRKAQFTAEELKKAFFTVFIPRLQYSLQVTHFTAVELDSVQAQYMGQFLQASHFPSLFPRAVVYALMIIGGLGLLRLLYKQGSAQVKTMIGLLWTAS